MHIKHVNFFPCSWLFLQLNVSGYEQSFHLYEIHLGAVRLFKHRASNTIVLTGLSGSGKTVLFYQVNMQERVLDDLDSFPLFSSLSTVISLIY